MSEPYAGGLDCPIFLPPAPLDVPLSDHLVPWKGREIWLELALDGVIITLTPEGAGTAPLPISEKPEDGHGEETLHCHYHIQLQEEQAKFTLFRTPEDLETLLDEAEKLGVTNAIGLYQELNALARQRP